MIQQILAIAGLDNMDEFHKKYPSKEKFLKAYPEASRLFEKHEQENFNPVAAYGGSMDHLDQMQYAKGGNVPENAKLWSQAKALAKSKFDVYPSKYANNWAAKWYKSKGGSWKKAAYGGMMYGAGGNTDQLGHYDPTLNTGGRPTTRPTGHYDIGGVIPQGAGTHGQQYTIKNGVAVPTGAYGGYYENGGRLPKEVLRSRLESHMSPAEADDYLNNYADGGETDPVEQYGMQGQREDARMEAASQLLQLIDTYAQLVGSDLDTEVATMGDMDDSQKKTYVMKMVKTIQAAQGASEGAQESAQEDYSDMSYKKGGIHIKPSHRGRFTEYKRRTGKTTEEALHSKDPHVRQMANFARNAAKWKHQEGGETMPQEQMEGAPQQAQEQAMGQEQQAGQDQMMQQLIQMVMQALQQGMQPEQIVQMLVQQGVPQEVAMQVIQMVMQQMQGGAPQGGPGQQYQPQGEQYQGPQGQQPQAAYGGFNESYSPFDY